MVRAPAKSCPNLSRLSDEAEDALLNKFLQVRAFKQLGWLDAYRDPVDDSQSEPADPLQRILSTEMKDQLNPLETEATRVVTIAGSRGQVALDGLARTKLEPERAQELFSQRDNLARSLWSYVHELILFEAAENSLHQRLYRRYDKHYQTFMVGVLPNSPSNHGQEVLEALKADLGERLSRGKGYSVDRFDIPADENEPASEMYMLFHPNPPTSVREIDDQGVRTRLYFRPPGEAMVVYSPSEGRIHVRASSRYLRHEIASSFVETVLDQELSSQPVDFQAYDISRFFDGFDLPLPDLGDLVINRAQVIRAEVSIGNLASRLALSTTIDHDMSALIEAEPGLDRVFERAVAIRFIEIAVRYRRFGDDKDRTLDFTITDRNTSSLMSLEDAEERVLGHRLMREWGILREGRAPDANQDAEVMAALLSLWEIGAKMVTGAWLLQRGVNVTKLTQNGFLVPAGWEGDDLIDDEEDLGQVAASVEPTAEEADLAVSPGQSAPGGSSERYRRYRVRDEWVAEHLHERASEIVDAAAVEELTPNLIVLGTLAIDGRDVPVYLARKLTDERAFSSIDTELRIRSDKGIGLVLRAGPALGRCLAANVVTSLSDHLLADRAEIAVDRDALMRTFSNNRTLARGGTTVTFEAAGENAGTLYVPDRGSITISGGHRVKVIKRLVNAHNSGKTPIASGDLRRGIGDQSLSNIFGAELWKKLQADFVRSPKQPLWEISL